MNAFLNYKRIQAFKVSRTAMANGVNYAYVVAPFLYEQSVLGFFRKVVFSLFFRLHISKFGSGDSELLLYYSCRHKQRADYDYIPRRLRELLGVRCDYIESSEHFSFSQILHTLKRLPRAWRDVRGYQTKTWQRLSCALLIAKYRFSAERTFTPLLQGKQKLVTFCDAQSPENLLTQMANFSGIETFTTQHGQYRILNSVNISSDAEAYDNFVSNYMLCWGEATRKEFVKVGFSSEQFIVTGWIKQWFETSPHAPCGVFGVMLNGENGKDSNISLLDVAKSIASKQNYRYIVRLHPWSKKEYYTRYLDDCCAGIGHYGLLSYLEQVDFSLAHMTAASIELLHANAPVYLLNDGRLADIFCVEGLSFGSKSLIVEAIVKDMDSPELVKERVQALSEWFNDDDAQNVRIREVLLGERS
ncbi:hypothetical protein D3C77_128920 [compost metagenome]